MEAVLVFPHQLFEKHPAFQKDRWVFLIEDPRFFSEFRYHKQKLVFHRASLKSFQQALEEKGFRTIYIESDLEAHLKRKQVRSLFVAQLDDFSLEKSLFSLVDRLKISIEVLESPGFLTEPSEFSALFKGKNHFRCDSFYIYQRKKFGILLDPKGKPEGGKWSLDAENRKKVPKGLAIPRPFHSHPSKFVEEALRYVSKNYSENPGDCESFNYPVTHSDALQSLRHFLKTRLCLFGDYEDAICQKEPILFHSCLSPLLNAGLLTPKQVLRETLRFAEGHSIPLNSLEGFIRQILGWREFVRGVYHSVGKKQSLGNFFNHKRKIPSSFYTGTTGILPVDHAIHNLLKNSYLHHIERLMVLGNFFLLCEFSPTSIYTWFMELFIDAYDWVMVPNVFGMSQYADGGIMTTKPYFSGSNYLLKMSDYPKGEWCEIWDALFWRFLIKHRSFFEHQPRLNILCKMADKKKNDADMLNIAERFLKGLKEFHE